MGVMWKDEAARQRMRAWHDRFRSAIATPLESSTVETAFGATHVLSGGPSNGAPLVLLHGAMASSAAVLLEVPALLERFRVHAVDVLGQSAMSAEVRLPVHDDSAGHWLREVMDGLGLASAAVVGVSWGGFVAQRFAAVAPERLSSLVLLVPAGMVTGPWWRGFREMGWPMTRYLMGPTQERRDRLLAGLLSTPDDPLWAPFIGEAFLAANLRTMRVPKLSRVGEFGALEAPVHVIGAERDVSFPGDLVVARARELFPTLRTAEVLPDARHSPPTTPDFRRRFSSKLAGLLTVG